MAVSSGLVCGELAKRNTDECKQVATATTRNWRPEDTSERASDWDERQAVVG